MPVATVRPGPCRVYEILGQFATRSRPRTRPHIDTELQERLLKTAINGRLLCI